MSKLLQNLTKLALIVRIADAYTAGMTPKVLSGANIGYDGRLITVECDMSNGLPGMVIVGLGNKAIDEAKERIRSAIRNSNLEMPRKRVILNLAPADLPKDGSCYDVPMAVAILAASGQLPFTPLQNTLIVGELSLSGRVQSVRGAIGYAEIAKQAGLARIIVPQANAQQAALVAGIDVFGVSTFEQLCAFLRGKCMLTKTQPRSLHQSVRPNTNDVRLEDIRGHEPAKRALIIAAAGRHHLLLHGPPGTGKTMLANALRSLLPPLSLAEVITTTKLHNLAGETHDDVLTRRPFRRPHHTASRTALIGGGNPSRPGEISLAHAGVLFLDELPEFPRQTLETLRQPLEDGTITHVRANYRTTYPAHFMLVATQNPCPCGYLGDPQHACDCTQGQIINYSRRISGPLLDRIDMQLGVACISPAQLSNAPETIVTSAQALEQIMRAKAAQQQRFSSEYVSNSLLTTQDIPHKAAIDPEALHHLANAAARLNLSTRSYLKVIRVARTIADLEDKPRITPVEINEALQYRQR